MIMGKNLKNHTSGGDSGGPMIQLQQQQQQSGTSVTSATTSPLPSGNKIISTVSQSYIGFNKNVGNGVGNAGNMVPMNGGPNGSIAAPVVGSGAGNGVGPKNHKPGLKGNKNKPDHHNHHHHHQQQQHQHQQQQQHHNHHHNNHHNHSHNQNMHHGPHHQHHHQLQQQQHHHHHPQLQQQQQQQQQQHVNNNNLHHNYNPHHQNQHHQPHQQHHHFQGPIALPPQLSAPSMMLSPPEPPHHHLQQQQQQQQHHSHYNSNNNSNIQQHQHQYQHQHQQPPKQIKILINHNRTTTTTTTTTVPPSAAPPLSMTVCPSVSTVSSNFIVANEVYTSQSNQLMCGGIGPSPQPQPMTSHNNPLIIPQCAMMDYSSSGTASPPPQSQYQLSSVLPQSSSSTESVYSSGSGSSSSSSMTSVSPKSPVKNKKSHAHHHNHNGANANHHGSKQHAHNQQQHHNNHHHHNARPIKYHILNDVWTFWYLRFEKNFSWEHSQIDLGTFNTVEKFWGIFDSLLPLTEAHHGCNYSLFKKGIRPIWEDQMNRYGGRFVFTINKDDRNFKDFADKMWLEFAMALIGNILPDLSEQICGIVGGNRNNLIKIAVWTRDCSKINDIIRIGQYFKKVGEYDKLVPYEVHMENNALQSGKILLKI